MAKSRSRRGFSWRLVLLFHISIICLFLAWRLYGAFKTKNANFDFGLSVTSAAIVVLLLPYCFSRWMSMKKLEDYPKSRCLCSFRVGLISALLSWTIFFIFCFLLVYVKSTENSNAWKIAGYVAVGTCSFLSLLSICFFNRFERKFRHI